MSTRVRPHVLGETLLWTVVVGLLGFAAFGPLGAALGGAFAVLHVVMRRREASASRTELGAWHLFVLPGLLGIALAATPLALWLFLVPCFLVLWLGTPLPARVWPSDRPIVRLAGLFVIGAATFACAVFPKHLDRSVGPAHYRQIDANELCARLREDHDIVCRLRPGVAKRLGRIDFEIPHSMARRAVLRKLAKENDLVLWLRGCGTGATLLWGGHYSATLLAPEAP